MISALSTLLSVAAVLSVFICTPLQTDAAGTNGVQTSNFRTGATLTQFSLDPWGDAAAVTNGKALLEDSTSIVVQHIHGFGGVFPRLEGGTYDWDAMDRRFDGTMSGVDNQVLTACCAPAYMEAPVGDGTENGSFSPYLRPRPEFYDAYAEDVVKTVQRYPGIKYIQVWNEMKGFWNPELNRWDYEAYTQLYNKIWDAVKAVRPDIPIGGPYVVLNSNGGAHWFNSSIGEDWGYYDQRDLDVVLYWLKNKNGADFITVDGKNRNKDGIEKVDPFERTQKFGVFMDWLRGLDETQYPGCKTLPLWWAEWYARTDDDPSSSPEEKNATMATGLIRTLRSGAQTAIIWGPQGDQDGNSFPLGLFSDTRIAGGGRETLFYTTQKFLKEHFGEGTAYFEHSRTNDHIESLLSGTHLMLVNMTDTQQTTQINAHEYNLGPYEVRLEAIKDTTPPTMQIDNPANGSTVNGSIDITASAEDNYAVAYVEIQINGTPITTDHISPYTFTWDSTQAANGKSEIIATAYDHAGLSASVTHIITVRNPGGEDPKRPMPPTDLKIGL